jgi:DNA-binding transcriptional ArsR family regulator
MGKKAPQTPGWVGNKGVLDLLEGRPGLLVADIVKATGLTGSTVAHHLDSLRRWGQAVAEPEWLEVVIPGPHGKIDGKVRRLRWRITARGRGRLKWCRRRDRTSRA